MLIGIDARMTPDLLQCLARMGHGDELVLADVNFPADSTARHCVIDTPLHLPGLDAASAAELICSVFPLDGYVPHCAYRMEVDDKPDEMTGAHTAVFDILSRQMPDGAGLGSLERQEFYRRAKTAFAVVHCSETTGFGCFILKKGVVF